MMSYTSASMSAFPGSLSSLTPSRPAPPAPPAQGADPDYPSRYTSGSSNSSGPPSGYVPAPGYLSASANSMIGASPFPINPPANQTTIVRRGFAKLKEDGLRSWIWSQRWLILREQTLTFHKNEVGTFLFPSSFLTFLHLQFLLITPRHLILITSTSHPILILSSYLSPHPLFDQSRPHPLPLP